MIFRTLVRFHVYYAMSVMYTKCRENSISFQKWQRGHLVFLHISRRIYSLSKFSPFSFYLFIFFFRSPTLHTIKSWLPMFTLNTPKNILLLLLNLCRNVLVIVGRHIYIWPRNMKWPWDRPLGKLLGINFPISLFIKFSSFESVECYQALQIT